MSINSSSLLTGTVRNAAIPSGMVSHNEYIRKKVSADLASSSLSAVTVNRYFNPVVTGRTAWYDVHVSPDGTKMFLATSGDYIRQYSLSTPFDPSSASYVREWNHTQYESNSFGFDISSDGQYLILCGHDEDSIILFNMTTPWDLSTLTYGAIPYKKYDNLANATGASDTATYSFEFNNDGTKVYFVAPNDRVAQRTLSTAYDISTAGGVTYYTMSTSPQNRTARSIRWKPDGTKFWILCDGYNDIFEFSVSTAWDVSSTVTEGNSVDLGTYETVPYDFQFYNNGSNLLVLGMSGDVFDRFSLSTAYDISSTLTHLGTTGAVDSNPTGFDFNSDGTVIAWCGYGLDGIYIGELSTPYDITSMGSNYARYDMNHFRQSAGNNSYYALTIACVRWQSDDILWVGDLYTSSDYDRIFRMKYAGKESTYVGDERYGLIAASLFTNNQTADTPYGCRYSYDGTKLWAIDNNRAFQYTVDPPWYGLRTIEGETTYNYDGSSIELDDNANDEGNTMCIAWSEDGRYLFTAGYGSDEIQQYKCGTPWTLAGAVAVTFMQSFKVTQQESTLRGIHVRGRNIYFIGSSSNKVYWCPIPY